MATACSLRVAVRPDPDRRPRLRSVHVRVSAALLPARAARAALAGYVDVPGLLCAAVSVDAAWRDELWTRLAAFTQSRGHGSCVRREWTFLCLGLMRDGGRVPRDTRSTLTYRLARSLAMLMDGNTGVTGRKVWLTFTAETVASSNEWCDSCSGRSLSSIDRTIAEIAFE
jgi:hypothetical protein